MSTPMCGEILLQHYSLIPRASPLSMTKLRELRRNVTKKRTNILKDG
jgi:hypothetical protein